MEEAVHQTLEAWKEGFPIREDGISLKDSFNQADLSALLPWQEKVSDKVELEVLIPKTDVDQVMHAITEGTNAQAEMTAGEECYYAEIDGVPTILEENII